MTRLVNVDVTVYDPDGEPILTHYENEMYVPRVGETIRETTIYNSSNDAEKNDYGEDAYEVVDVETEFRTKPDLPGGEGMVQMVYVHTEIAA